MAILTWISSFVKDPPRTAEGMADIDVHEFDMLEDMDEWRKFTEEEKARFRSMMVAPGNELGETEPSPDIATKSKQEDAISYSEPQKRQTRLMMEMLHRINSNIELIEASAENKEDTRTDADIIAENMFLRTYIIGKFNPGLSQQSNTI